MYLGEVNDVGDDRQQLGFSFTKLVRQITAPVLKAQQAVHAAVVKVVPGAGLKSLVGKISASAERATAQTLRPFDTGKLLKQELQQIKTVAQTKDVQKIAAGVLAAAAIYFTGGAAAPAVLALLKAAADRTAAKKAAAKSQQEADAAQAEFDQYAQQLASQSGAGATPALPTLSTQITPGYVDRSGAPAFFPDPGAAGGDVSSPLAKRAAMAPGGALSNLPPWVVPAAVAGVAAVVILPALLKKRS